MEQLLAQVSQVQRTAPRPRPRPPAPAARDPIGGELRHAHDLDHHARGCSDRGGSALASQRAARSPHDPYQRRLLRVRQRRPRLRPARRRGGCAGRRVAQGHRGARRRVEPVYDPGVVDCGTASVAGHFRDPQQLGVRRGQVACGAHGLGAHARQRRAGGRLRRRGARLWLPCRRAWSMPRSSRPPCCRHTRPASPGWWTCACPPARTSSTRAGYCSVRSRRRARPRPRAGPA